MTSVDARQEKFILIVEDDPGVMELETQRLAPLGLEIRRALSAAEALDALKAGAPEMMLVDYSLPDGSALDLVKSVAAAGLECPPFIIATGRGDEALAVASMKAGAVDYIVKDSNFLERLRLVVEKGINDYRLRRQLRETEERFRTLFECGNDGMFMHSIGPGSAAGHFVEVNGAACERLGYTREELLRMGPADIDAEGMDERRAQALAKLEKEGHIVFEMVHRARDGGKVPVEISARRFEFDGKPYVFSMARDISERRAAESVLRENERRYRSLVEAMPDIVMRFDRECRYLYASSNVEAVFGIKPEAYMGHTHAELGFPPELCLLLENRINEAFVSSQPAETEVTYGEGPAAREFNWRLVPEKDGTGLVVSVLTIARDITDLKRLEADYKNLFDSMLDGFVLHEMVFGADGRPADYRFLSLNPAFEAQTGLKAEATVGRLVSEIMPDLYLEWVEIYGRVVVTGEPSRFERFSAPLGRYYDVLAFRPRPGQFACIFKDITDRKTDEEKLRESEVRFRALFENHSAVKIIVDPETHLIVDANPAAAKFYGWPRQKMIGMSIDDINTLPPKSVEQQIDDAVQGKTIRFEFKHRRADGSTRDVEVFSSKFSIKGKTLLHSIVHDITERKRMEDDLVKSQKIESLGVMAGGIAHDFNNMLVGIVANLSLLATKNPSAEDILQDALQAARGAQALTAQLLSFSSGGKPVRKEFCLQKSLRDIFHLATRGCAAARELDIDSRLWSVDGDEQQIKQAVNNILLNGMQAMPGGGTIRLKARNMEVSADSGLPVAPGKYVEVLITDTGSGIAGEDLPHIFEPYFTTKPKGHGLGLPMAWTVVKNHGGHIAVESGPGGTEFRLLLPATGLRLDWQASEQTVIAKGSGRILVLEDEEIVARAAERMLAELGYTFELTTDGRQTLRRYAEEKAAGRPFAAVVMDLTIPGGMGGREAGAELRRLHPGAVIIVSSGYSDESVMADHKAYGFDAVLPKPYRFEDLAETLARLLGKY